LKRPKKTLKWAAEVPTLAFAVDGTALSGKRRLQNRSLIDRPVRLGHKRIIPPSIVLRAFSKEQLVGLY